MACAVMAEHWAAESEPPLDPAIPFLHNESDAETAVAAHPKAAGRTSNCKQLRQVFTSVGDNTSQLQDFECVPFGLRYTQLSCLLEVFFWKTKSKLRLDWAVRKLIACANKIQSTVWRLLDFFL